MTPRFSIYLDFLRFLAAMIVFVSHFAYPRFTDGDYIIVREFNLGSDAVVFFFVLSGLVIGYTADVKDKTLKDFSFHRLTRLYSVVIPALLITVLMDQIGKGFAPENYDGWWYVDNPVWLQLWRGLTFSNHWLNDPFRIGSNGPYWSLSYESAYYMLFGTAFYLAGLKRIFLIMFLIFIFGFSVMFLFPAWLLGFWAYKQIKADDLPSQYVWPLIVVPPIFYVLFLSIGVPKLLLALSAMILGADFVTKTLGFSDEFLWNIIIAQFVALHLIGIAALYQRTKTQKISGRINKYIRWCAGATFTIYVIHYPALQMADTLLPSDIPRVMRDFMLFFGVLILCFGVAEISERRLKLLRNMLSNSSK